MKGEGDLAWRMIKQSISSRMLRASQKRARACLDGADEIPNIIQSVTTRTAWAGFNSWTGVEREGETERLLRWKKKTQKFKVERESKNETRQTKWSNTLETWSSSLFWPVGIRLWQTSSSLLSTDTQTHTPCFPGGPDLSQLGSVNFSDSVGGGEKLEKDKHTHTHTHRLGSIYLRIRFRPLFNCASVSGSVSTAHSHQAGAFTAVTPRHQHGRQPDHHSQTQSLAVFYSRAICLQLKRELNRWPCTYQTPSV